jgi:hypothetical protein
MPAAEAAILEQLIACLEHWREEGVREVEVSPDLLQSLIAPARPAPGPAGRQPPTTSAPLRPAPPPRAAPTPAAPPRTVQVPVSVCLVERLAELNDPRPPDQTRVRLVAEPACFQGTAGELLDKLVRAIGYTRLGGPEPHPGPAAGPLAGILLLGPNALAMERPEQKPAFALGKVLSSATAPPTLFTHDPMELERLPELKRAVWEHLQLFLTRLRLPPPPWVAPKRK